MVRASWLCLSFCLLQVRPEETHKQLRSTKKQRYIQPIPGTQAKRKILGRACWVALFQSPSHPPCLLLRRWSYTTSITTPAAHYSSRHTTLTAKHTETIWQTTLLCRQVT